ncbi:MAG: hypothetical protein AB8H86_06640 [Polyangiales bacterium]
MPEVTPNLVPKQKRSLNILTVPEPCAEPWDEMSIKGEGRRHCDMCMQDVFDLSTMTQLDAEALVFENTGNVCVRFFRREDGTIVTSDCTPVRKRALTRAAGGVLKTGLRVASACLALLAAFGVARAAGVDMFGWARGTSIGKHLLMEEVPQPLAGAPMAHWEEPEVVSEPVQDEAPAQSDTGGDE